MNCDGGESLTSAILCDEELLNLCTQCIENTTFRKGIYIESYLEIERIIVSYCRQKDCNVRDLIHHIFTTRARSMTRGYFHKCVSVQVEGKGVPHSGVGRSTQPSPSSQDQNRVPPPDPQPGPG